MTDTINEQPDWEINPDDYLKDADGEFILKVDGTPKKKPGRPQGSKGRGYNFHSKTKAKQRTEKKLREKRKKIALARTKIANYKKDIEQTKETLSVLDGKKRLITDEFLDDLSPTAKKEITQDIIFKANEGPQENFLAAGETDVLYGGSAGGGKSYAMIVDPLRFAHKPAHRALILRRSMPELRELIDKSRELYPKAFPGCKYREVETLCYFPSAAKIKFVFLLGV